MHKTSARHGKNGGKASNEATQFKDVAGATVKAKNQE